MECRNSSSEALSRAVLDNSREVTRASGRKMSLNCAASATRMANFSLTDLMVGKGESGEMTFTATNLAGEDVTPDDMTFSFSPSGIATANYNSSTRKITVTAGATAGATTLTATAKKGTDRITASATVAVRSAVITVDYSDKWLMNTKYVTYGLYTQTAKSTFSMNSDPFAILLPTRTNGTAPTSSYPNYYHQYATVSSVSGVTFNGNSTWAIPSKSDFDSIIASGSASVNGTASVRWARVSVDVSNSTYAGKGYTNSSQYVPGLLLFPNSSSVTVNGITNTGAANFTTNVISYVDCKFLYENGCVFLPAAGYYYDGSWYAVGSYGLYWSSTEKDSKYAYCLGFGSSNVDSDWNYKTSYHPVVLVRE